MNFLFYANTLSGQSPGHLRWKRIPKMGWVKKNALFRPLTDCGPSGTKRPAPTTQGVTPRFVPLDPQSGKKERLAGRKKPRANFARGFTARGKYSFVDQWLL
jgi:hypothetical protein